jgi:hypothetical protein
MKTLLNPINKHREGSSIVSYIGMAWLLFVIFSANVYAADAPNDEVSRIEKVDHNTHSLIINDKTYFMLIGLKVYIYDGKTRKKEIANRYALQEGQVVFGKAETRNRQRYLSEITIFR